MILGHIWLYGINSKKMQQIVHFNYRNHLTNTFDSSVIQVVSKGAFTAERTIRVDADTILADAWVIQTLIRI